ncbi:MAG: tetratricopeptide repeat protein [Chloroflexi bacterium]|nr:tetratricopeptide repeat protein [Chloroflexota bacterium]
MGESMTFVQWLKRLRAEQDLTQEMLAEKVGCATPTLRSFEIGKRRPSREMAERLADVLGVPGEQRAEFLRLARLPVEAQPDLTEAHHTELASAAVRQTSQLPLPKTAKTLIGREAERNVLIQLLHDEHCRLVTVLGAGGMGKTQLALDVAHALAPHFPEGAVFVALAPIQTAQHLPSAVIEALGLALLGASDPNAQLLAWLEKRQILLVLDNFEHLLGDANAVAWIAELLHGAPALQLLITSRERLRLRGERTFDLGGLTLPGAMLPPEQADAVLLFLERARQVTGDFALDTQNRLVIGRICQLLGGMPLGIELAAAWVRVLEPAEIASEIEKNMDFLALADRDALPRHRSMRAVFDHSWRLLSDEERAVLMKLAVFRGGSLREAAEAVAQATLPVLASLIDKSLVRRLDDRRFDLHELIRQFAAQQLAERAETQVTKDRHLAYFRQFALKAEEGMNQADQATWLARVEREQDNLRAALAWAFEEGAAMPQRVAQGLTLVAALYRFWQGRGYLTEGRQWMERGLAQGQGVAPATIAHTLNMLGWLAHQQGESHYAHRLLEQSLALFRQLNDEPGLAEVLDTLGDLTWGQGDLGRGVAYYEESLALRRRLGQPGSVAMSLYSLGRLYVDHNENQAAATCFAEAMTILEAVHDRRGLALTINGLGRLALNEQAYTLAGEHFRRALDLFHQLGNKVDIAECFEELALVAHAAGQPQRAATLWAAGEALRQEINIHALRYNQVLAAPMLAQIDAPTIAAGRAAARQCSLDVAVAYALGTT